MREYVKQQLAKCAYANLNHYDEATNTFIIPKYTKPKYDLGKMYLIQIPAIMVNNPTSVLACNWNNSTSPKSSYLKIYVSKTAGKMIYVDSIGYDMENRQDLSIMWSGWLPIDEITQIATL
jgi:hypothetical protein